MLDIRFGDICICDLALCRDHIKTAVVPLIFIGKEEPTEGCCIYKFCRVGKQPELHSKRPHIITEGEQGLRDGSAIYPTQTVLFSDEEGVIRKVGAIASEATLAFIRDALQEKRKRNNIALVMALCPRCRQNFMTDPELIVKREDPYFGVRSQCDFCQTRSGFTYLIYRKNGREWETYR